MATNNVKSAYFGDTSTGSTSLAVQDKQHFALDFVSDFESPLSAKQPAFREQK